jgi:hypothetical protein
LIGKSPKEAFAKNGLLHFDGTSSKTKPRQVLSGTRRLVHLQLGDENSGKEVFAAFSLARVPIADGS